MMDIHPKTVRYKHGAYYWVQRQKWVHLGRDQVAAAAKYNVSRIAAGLSANWIDYRVYLAGWKKAIDNAKKRSLQFALYESDLNDLIRESRHRCALTFIPFDLVYKPNCSRRPFAPSLDRIDSQQGYITGNVRLVCFAINVALADWGEDVLRRIAVAYAKRDQRRLPRLPAGKTTP